MLNTRSSRHWLKYVVALVMCVGIRLIPWRLPNFEPILATGMPFSEKIGPFSGFLFAVLSIVFYDSITGALSTWTPIIAGTYGAIAIGGGYFLKNNRGSVAGYLAYSVIGTLVFDAVTGLAIGPLFYGQPFMDAFLGQIPFTINHLLGNLFLSLTLSPAVYRWIVSNKRLEPAWFLRKRSVVS